LRVSLKAKEDYLQAIRIVFLFLKRTINITNLIKEITHTHQPVSFETQNEGLKKYISAIMYFGNHLGEQAPLIFDFEPAASVMILLELENDVSQPGLRKARILGPHLCHVPHFLPANAKMWAVLFKVSAWFHLTGMTVFALLDRCMPLSEPFGEDELAGLFDTLQNHEGELSKPALAIESYLQTQFGRSRGKKKPYFQQTIANMETRNGFSRVEDFLTEKIKIRSLERYCRSALGIPPKSFLELLRYHQIMRCMQKNQKVQWNDLVFQGFYTDDAHYQRDYKRLSKPGVLKGCESLHV